MGTTLTLGDMTASAVADYKAMIVAITGGLEPTPDVVRATCFAANKKLEQVQADVELLGTRRVAAGNLQYANDLQPKIDKAIKAHAAAVDKLATVREKAEKMIAKAQSEANAAGTERDQLENRQCRLRYEANTALFATSVPEIDHAISAAEREISDLRDRANNLGQEAIRLAGVHPSRSEQQQYVERCDDRISAMKSIEDKRKGLEDKIIEFRKSKLDPDSMNWSA